MFKPIAFMYSEFYIEIEPKDYIWDVYGDGETCTLLLIANSYDFFLLGQPVYQGYYTVHNMRSSTIKYAPLRDSGKEPPQRGEIPTAVMVPSEPPSFLQQYGQFLFLLLCIAIGALLIQPQLENRWDINNTDEQWKFIAVYVVYGIFCIGIWVFILQPMF